MNKKIKAVLLTLWFGLSVILTPILILKYKTLQEPILNLGIINMSISFILLISDKELIEMKLW